MCKAVNAVPYSSIDRWDFRTKYNIRYSWSILELIGEVKAAGSTSLPGCAHAAPICLGWDQPDLREDKLGYRKIIYFGRNLGYKSLNT